MAIGWNAVGAAARAVAVLGLTAGGPAMGQVFEAVNFAQHPGPARIAAEGAEVTLRRIDDDGLIKASAAIKIPGFAPIVVTEDAGADAAFDRWVGIGKLAAADAAPSVLLQGFTGGAHCCATLTVVTPWQGALEVLEFAAIDGAGGNAFPVDVDKNGVIDFQRQDDRFRYQFASGAGSYSAPLFFNIRQGKLVDVSSEPGFAAFWEDYARETRALCADQDNDERNAACAVYVVAGAHLGRFAAAIRDANALANNSPSAPMPEACKVALIDHACPQGQAMKFADFEAALRWVLEYGKSSN